MNYEIAIPTYRRCTTIAQKTIAYLKLGNPTLKNVTVFVASSFEKEVYRKALGDDVKIVLGVPTLRKQRAFIERYYPKDTYLVMMDDDIEGIYRKVDNKTTVLHEDFDYICRRGFAECEKAGTRIWGINPVLNPFYMKGKVSTTLKYVVGCTYGVIVTHDPFFDGEMEDKEDYERTIKYYMRYKGVVRLDWFAPKTNYYGEPGGMQEDRTEQRITESAEFLAKKYPQFCSLNHKKAHTELRLHHKK